MSPHATLVIAVLLIGSGAFAEAFEVKDLRAQLAYTHAVAEEADNNVQALTARVDELQSAKGE